MSQNELRSVKTIAVIGGGAAGMFAAGILAEAGHKVTVFEKNEKLGKKLFITGKGRCNFTNDCDRDTFFSSVISNPRFLYSAFRRFDPQDAIAYFENAGLKTKVERGRRAFPASDHAWDVIDTLKRILTRNKAEIKLNTKVLSLLTDPETQTVKGVRFVAADTADSRPEEFSADAVILATGGLSYPATGSTGDGYTFARACGHTVTSCRPSLVPFEVKEKDRTAAMAGLSLKNVTLTVCGENGKKIYEGFGEMLFTHEGISGPLVLSASAYASRFLENGELKAFIDLKPAVDAAEFDARLVNVFSGMPKKGIHNALKGIYPNVMIDMVLQSAGIVPETVCGGITKEMRKRLVGATKAFPFTVSSTAGFSQAVITQGGVSVKEIEPSTMESKKIKGLYVIGEVLDVDALTGGFNLQIAWSTAYAAAAALIG